MSRIFVTGAAGFIGKSLVEQAVAQGHQVVGLTRSPTSAETIKAAGAEAILGDLQVAGEWQGVAADCQFVVHLAQPDTYGARVTAKRAEDYRKNREQMDRLLLSSLDVQRVQKIVFVCGTSYYGEQGEALRSEETVPNPKGWGPYIAPAIEMLPSFVAKGLPIVEAYPGWVYGPGSWFAEYQLTPLRKGRRVMRLAGPPQLVSPVHVKDCAGAVLHLLDHGEVGSRYFVVDDEAVRSTRMVEVAATAMGKKARTIPLPKLFCRLAMGPVITDSMTCSFHLSNQRLLASGFRFNYPSIESGIPDVVDTWLRENPSGS